MTRNGDGELEQVMSWINTRVQAEKLTIFGRTAAALVSEASHHGAPWPSMTPEPLISTSCRLEPEMKFAGDVTPPGYLSNGSMVSVAPASSWRLRLFTNVNGPHRKYPGVMRTVPPPARLAALMAL